LKVTCTEEAVADVVQAITYLTERNPTAIADFQSARHDAGIANRTINMSACCLGC
jgi:hypothetical protein